MSAGGGALDHEAVDLAAALAGERERQRGGRDDREELRALERAKSAEVSPEHRAKCAAKTVRKAMAEGQPIDLAPCQLDDAAWSELVTMLSDAELAALNA